jgi:hypothetical protein
MASIFTADNGMTLKGASTAGTIVIAFGFRWTVLQSGTEDAQSDEVEASFAANASQATVREAVRAALVAWATARGHTIVRHIRQDLSLVQP